MAIISVDNLSVTRNHKTICDDLNITINPGEVWGVLGCNGVGKSTLLHALIGLYPVLKGSIQLSKKPLSQLTRQQIAKHTAILFQHYEDPFPCSVLQTVLSGRHPHLKLWQWETSDDHQIAMQALQQVGLVDMAKRDIKSLSGGERRRVAIATVLAQTPDCFLLDEPISHLDLHHQIDLLNHFKQLAKQHNKAIIMVLHDINLTARYCDHLIMLFANGRSKIGSKPQLLQQSILEELYQHKLMKIDTEQGEFWLPQ